MTSASFSPSYVADNNEICGTYLATTFERTWLVQRRRTYVGRPYVPGDSAFQKPQPALTLP